MIINFKINKYFLLTHALGQVDLPFPEWENLQNALWEKFPQAFYLLTTHPEVAFVGKKPWKQFQNTCEQIRKMMQMAFRSKEFMRLYKESKKYLVFAKKQWQTNGIRALKILEELSGLSVPNKKITVLITHPNLYRGFAMPTHDVIGFGYAEDYTNSTTINLCHEIMHFITKNTKTMHAIIELMVNNELRIRLNKGGRYSIYQKGFKTKDSPLYSYVNRLRDLEKRISPFWLDYLKSKSSHNIIELEKKIKRKMKAPKSL